VGATEHTDWESTARLRHKRFEYALVLISAEYFTERTIHDGGHTERAQCPLVANGLI
jgi:hypothetical protein